MNRRGDPVAPSDRGESDTVIDQRFSRFHQITAKQAEQDVHLLGWAPPVLAREGEQGQDRYGLFAGCFSHPAYGFHTSLVSAPAWHPTPLSPPPVSIHDD